MWIQTTEKEKRFTFESNSANGGLDSLTLLKGYHVIVIEAVDNHGAPGPSAYRAFFSWTTAPTVQIDVPRPHGTSQLLVPPSVRFKWEGHDESGAYSPVFELSTNVLYFRVGYATAVGPIMTVFNDTFFYKYPGSGFNPVNAVPQSPNG